MLEMDTAALPVLVIVTDCDALHWSNVVDPNAMLVAERLTGGSTPVPLNEMLCGEPGALSVMVTAAVIRPPAVGWKCPWMVHCAPAATLVPQVLANTN